MYCTSIKIRPKPNSIAEKIRKKNVNDNKLTLSKINPINKVIIYNDIHSNSAVNNKCKAVLILIIIIKKKKKNKNITMFKSPNTI